MQIGSFTVEQLSEGFFELFADGTFKKMDPSRLDNAKDDDSLGKYSLALGIDPLLIQKNGTNIIVDPGLGWGLDVGSQFKNTSNVVTNLDIFGVKPDDIHLVILTHLHFDHAAGASFISDKTTTKATFPNARYIVHKNEWEWALSQIDDKKNHIGANYYLDEFYRLVADNRILFHDEGIFELVEGLFVIKTGGHTPGHLIVKLKDGGNTAYFMGDLIPTEYHLNHYSMKSIDHNPLQSKKAKTLILKQAFNENAVMFFYHSLFRKSGHLSRDRNKKYVLVDV